MHPPRTHELFTASLLLTLFLVLPGCVPTSEQLAVREELAEIGLEYDRAVFFNRIHRGDVEAVRLFLEAGMSPNAVTDDRKPAFVVAYEHAQPEIVRMLLDAGALRYNGQGVTPLHVAAQLGDMDDVGRQLARGSDPEARDHNGVTPLLVAVPGGHLDVVEALLEAGASADVRAGRGATALMMAAWHGHAGLVRRLLAAGADPAAAGEHGTTALTYAARLGSAQIIALLLEAESSLVDHTHLLEATGSGNPEAVRLLLEAGADPNISVGRGGTPLMLAAYAGHAEVARVLLEEGADPNALPERGGTALQTALERGHEDVAAVLREGGAEL